MDDLESLIKTKFFPNIDITGIVREFRIKLELGEYPNYFLEILIDTVGINIFEELVKYHFDIVKNARTAYLESKITDVPDELLNINTILAEIAQIRADEFFKTELLSKMVIFACMVIKNPGLSSLVSDLQNQIDIIKDKVIIANMLALGIPMDEINQINLRQFELRDHMFDKFINFIDHTMGDTEITNIQRRLNYITTNIDNRIKKS